MSTENLKKEQVVPITERFNEYKSMISEYYVQLKEMIDVYEKANMSLKMNPHINMCLFSLKPGPQKHPIMKYIRLI